MPCITRLAGAVCQILTTRHLRALVAGWEWFSAIAVNNAFVTGTVKLNALAARTAIRTMASLINVMSLSCKVSQTSSRRFRIFKQALSRELGMDCELLANGKVFIYATEFNPQQTLNTLQAAIDHFVRFMPDELTNY